MSKLLKLTSWTTAGLCSAPYFLLYFFNDNLTHYLFKNNLLPKFPFLENIPVSEQLDFYVGHLTNHIYGPLASILSILALLIICLKLLDRLNFWSFAGIILAYFTLTRFEVFFYPPFGEAATGPFSDTIWLIRHSMDIAGLHQQLPGGQGGPLYYPASLFPIFAASLYKIIPHPVGYLFAMHSIYFVFASFIISMCRSILEKSLTKEHAFIASLCLLMFPLFQSMSEILNMEIPSTFFAMLAIYFLIREKIGLATAMSIIGVMIKLPAATACGVVALFCAIRTFDPQWKSEKTKSSVCALIAVIAVGLKLFLRLHFRGEQVIQSTILPLVGMKNVFIMPSFYLLLLATVIIIFAVLKSKSYRASRHILICLTASLAWYGVYINFSVMAPRYLLLLLPFAVMTIAFAINILFENKKTLQGIIFFCALLLCALTSYGHPGQKYVEPSPYCYNDSERSLEYRNMMKLQLKILNTLHEKYPRYIIGAPHVTAQSLVFEELNFVPENRDTIPYGIRPVHGLKPFPTITHAIRKNIVWVGFKAKRYDRYKFDYPITEKDVILDHLWYGDRNVYFFKGGYAIEYLGNLVSKANQRLGK